MWMGLVSGFQALAAANAENQAENVIPEGMSDAAGEQNGNVPGFDGKMPTAQEILEALDSMTGISEEEKESIREQLLNPGGSASQTVAGNDFTTQTIMLLSLLAVIALIFVFFVYKLFKCLSEREMKREEKKKNKQLKKKK